MRSCGEEGRQRGKKGQGSTSLRGGIRSRYFKPRGEMVEICTGSEDDEEGCRGMGMWI